MSLLIYIFSPFSQWGSQTQMVFTLTSGKSPFASLCSSPLSVSSSFLFTREKEPARQSQLSGSLALLWLAVTWLSSYICLQTRSMTSGCVYIALLFNFERGLTDVWGNSKNLLRCTGTSTMHTLLAHYDCPLMAAVYFRNKKQKGGIQIRFTVWSLNQEHIWTGKQHWN